MEIQFAHQVFIALVLFSALFNAYRSDISIEVLLAKDSFVRNFQNVFFFN